MSKRRGDGGERSERPVREEKRLCALRGAACCLNEEEDIILQVSALYDELLRQNKLEEEDLVSVIFSVSADIDALNPAAALRRAGRGASLALFVAQEGRFAGGLERTIRVLMHCYLPAGAVPRHCYRNGAEVLRPERSGMGLGREDLGEGKGER